jgi:hypothetical protein
MVIRIQEVDYLNLPQTPLTGESSTEREHEVHSASGSDSSDDDSQFEGKGYTNLDKTIEKIGMVSQLLKNPNCHTSCGDLFFRANINGRFCMAARSHGLGDGLRFHFLYSILCGLGWMADNVILFINVNSIHQLTCFYRCGFRYNLSFDIW